MTNKIIQKLYNGDVELVFYPDSHQYKMDGKNKMSVTSVLDVVDKSRALVKWAVDLTKSYLLEIIDSGSGIKVRDVIEACAQHIVKKEQAATIGTMVHNWCERYAAGLNPPMPDDEKVLNGVLAFLKWANDNQVKFVNTEKLVYSRKYDYVGTLDVIFTMGKEDHKIIHIGDYKTASGIYSTALYQTAAYVAAQMEEYPDLNYGTSWILRFAKEDKYKDGKLIEEAGTFEVKEISSEEHQKNLDAFVGCIALKKREKELYNEWVAANK